MNNFEIEYATDGTSALQPACETIPAHASIKNVIVFPQYNAPRGVHAAAPSYGPIEGVARKSYDRILCTKVVRDLRFGSAQGKAFDRMERWQTLVAGTFFAACAFLCLFLGL